MAKLNWSKVKQPCFVWKVRPSDAVCKALTDPNNPASGYHRVTGNRKALRLLGRFAEGVLKKWDHDAGTKAVALVGPSSSGKTWTAESHATVLGLPFVEVAPEFASMDALFARIKGELERAGLKLVAQKKEADQPFDFVFPPVVVFIDEAHMVKKPLQKGGLLKAIDDADRTMLLSDGTFVNTSKVHWVIGTTEFYDLFDPLRKRFDPITLVSHTKAELAEMVLKKHPDLGDAVAKRVAHYVRIPRAANNFVKSLREYKDSSPSESWLTLVEEVARDKEIGANGLTLSEMKVLEALSSGPVGKEALPSIVGLRAAELWSEVIPTLEVNTPDMPALVVRTRKGIALTDAGRGVLAAAAVAA